MDPRLLLVAAALALAGCATLPEPPPPGAAACSGCHAASAKADTPVPRIAGASAPAIVKAMQEFRSGQRPATVMDRIAKGFTDEEVQAIAKWYSAQK
jgi:cytochrome c553